MTLPPDKSQLLQQLMDQMPTPVFLKDLDSRLILLNKAEAERRGLQQEAIDTDASTESTEALAQDTCADEIKAMERGAPMLRKQEKQINHDGSVTWFCSSKVPLRDTDGSIIGVIGIRYDITELKQKELELEEANRRLTETNLKLNSDKAHIAHDLRMAAQLQETFLPKTYPELLNADGKKLLDFHHFYEPSLEVGGDFCAVHQLSETKAGLLICDVMGHGVRAALVTSIIHTLAASLALKHKTPDRFLSEMNRLLHPILQTDEAFLFATACYLTIDTATGFLEGAIAGHTMPLLIQPRLGKVTSMNAVSMFSGPALAITDDHDYKMFSIQLHPGDEILIYTDGISEALNTDRDEFGDCNLQQTVQNLASLPLKELLPHIVQVVRDYAGQNKLGDDICLLGFTLNGLQ